MSNTCQQVNDTLHVLRQDNTLDSVFGLKI